jgi:pseudouridylate synthase I
MRFFIRLSFHGANYSGWQIQQNANSVQAQLERALSVYLGENIGVCGAGRTDAGVHGINYVAHFDSQHIDLSQKYIGCIYKLNAILPADITIHAITPVAEDAHARFDAIQRSYAYYIHCQKHPFISDVSTFLPYTPDIEAMNRAASLLLGTHDFTSFAKLHGGAKTSICTLTEARWEALYGSIDKTTALPAHLLPPEAFVFHISADRFLRNMVRSIVGTLLEIGRGKRPETEILDVLAKKSRSAAGNSVAARGLFLTNVEYPYQIA